MVLDALDDIDIDTAQISSSLDRLDVAEAANATTQYSGTISSLGEFEIINGLEESSYFGGTTTWNVSGTPVSTSGKLANAIKGYAVNFYLVCNITNNKSSKNQYWSGTASSTSGNVQVSGQTSGTGNNLTSNTKTLNPETSSISASVTLSVNYNALSGKARMEHLRIILTKNDSSAPEVSATGLTSMNYTTSSQFTVTDTAAGIYSVSYTYYTLNNVPDSSKNKSFSYSDRTTEETIDMPYEGKYEITVEDNVGNKRTVTYYRYEADIQFKSANSSQGTVNVTAVTEKTSGSTYDVSATVTPADGYYFTGWVRTGDGGTANFGVGTYSSGKWEHKSQTVPAYEGGTITWTAQFAPISAWFNYSSGSSMTYNGSAQTNIASISTKNDNGGGALNYTLTYAGTTKAGNTYDSSDKPKYAGTYYAELTVTKGGASLGSGDSSASAFTINQATLTLTPVFTGTMNKVYNGTTELPGVGCSSWSFDDSASPQSSDGLSAATKTDSEFSFKIPDANAGAKTIQICGAGGATLNAGSSLAAYVTLSTTLSDAADRAASYAPVFSGDTANYTITKKTVYVNLTYDGTVSGYVGEALYNDVPGKVYDGTTEAKLNITLNGLVNNETYSVGEAEKGKTVYLTYSSYSFSYSNPDQYTITVNSLALKDGDGKASNYSLDSASATCTGIYIVRKTVKLEISGETSKVYDGTDVASPTVVFAAGYEPLQDDNISIKAGSASYSKAEVGTGLTVTLSGYSLDGTNKGYYYLDTETVTSDSGEITARPLTVTFTYGGKVYDGTTAVETEDFTFDYAGLIAGDDVTASCTALFDNANAGTRKVSSSDITISGDDVGNYNLTSTSYTLNEVTISRRSVEDNDDIVLILDTEGIPSHTYDGKAYNPTPGVIDKAIGENGTPLVFDTDYDRGYDSSNIVNAGEYSFVVTGKNNYIGSKSFSFEITKADLKLTAENISLVYGQTLNASQIVGKAVNAVNEELVVAGTWSFVTEIAYNASLTSKGNFPLVSSSGTVTVLFTVSDTDTSPFNTRNYNLTEETTLELTVTPREISIIAKAQSSVYGTDPKFDKTAYTATVTLAEGEILNFAPTADDSTLSAGALDCAVAYNSNVGTYPISSTFASDNYTIAYTSADFTVTKLGVTVVPDSGQQKYFGDADPAAFTYATTTTQTLAAGFTVSLDGALARAAGDTVGTYYYSLGTITDANNPNYTISLNNTRSFAVLARPITVAASSYEVYFGEAFPALDFTVTDGLVGTVTPVIGTDESGNQTITVGSQTVIFDISVIRTAKGSSVATSAITVGTYDTYAVLGTNANFTVTATRGTFEILRRPVTVTPNGGQYKTYGSSDPSSFAYTVAITPGHEGLTGDAQVTNYSIAGVLTREAGENVGSYEIYQGTVTDENNPNYSITFTEGVTYAIERKSVIITPTVVNIDFGDPLPEENTLTYTAIGVLEGETLVGGLKFAPDVYELAQQGSVPVGNYNIVADSELNNDRNPNYDITEVRGTDALRVLALTAYIEADGNSIVFGTETYTLNFTAHDRKGKPIDNDIFSGELALRDNVSGILAVGNYDIDRGTLKCANYVVTLSGNPQLSVTPKLVTVTSSDIDQIYGETRLTPEFSVTGLVDGYTLDAQSALGVSYPDREAVGKYAITLGNLESLSLNPNYDFVFDKEYFYYIVARPIVIVPHEGISSVYGDTEVNITYTTYFYGDEGKEAGLIGTDTLGGKLSRENSTNKNVGSYAVILGTLNNSSVAGYNANYTVELSDTKVYYEITPRPVTVTANALSQVFGEAERVLTVSYSAGGLVGGDSLYGSPERESGVTPGIYAITQGSLGNEEGANPNYAITFVGSTYTITKRPLSSRNTSPPSLLPAPKENIPQATLTPTPLRATMRLTISSLTDTTPLSPSREVRLSSTL